jgi:hypothetical protein
MTTSITFERDYLVSFFSSIKLEILVNFISASRITFSLSLLLLRTLLIILLDFSLTNSFDLGELKISE